MTALLLILASLEFPFAALGAAVVTHAVRDRLYWRSVRKAADAHMTALRKRREARA